MQTRITYQLLLGLIVLITGCKEVDRNYYPKGSLKFEVTLKDGKREGKSTQFYESGEIQIVSYWSNGHKEGESISYFRNGETNIKVNYKNNKANGSALIYDSLGNLIEKYEVKDNLKNGKFIEYFPSGRIRVEGLYVNDMAQGRGVEYYEDGTLFRTYFYDRDTIVYLKGFDKNGVLYDCVLPIIIHENGQDEVSIKLIYSEYDSVRIGVIIGDLDNKKQLMDTIEVLGSNGLEVRYKLQSGHKSVTGWLFEIKMPEDEITGEYFFEKSFIDKSPI